MSTEITRPLRADAQRTRGELIAAAERVLAVESGASVDQIAAAAGVGRATAFRHFPTREALVTAAWRAAAESAVGELDEVALDAVGDAEILDALIAAMVRVGERHPLLVVGARPAAAELAETFATTDRRLQAAVRRAQRAGAARDDLPVALLTEYLLATVEAVLASGLGGERALAAARSLVADGVRPS